MVNMRWAVVDTGESRWVVVGGWWWVSGGG